MSIQSRQQTPASEAANDTSPQDSRPRSATDISSKRKRKDLGRSKYENSSVWSRERNEESKRRRLERDDYQPAIYVTEFSKDEIASEERKPKRKVAVMIGYSGTGYHGMQLNHTSKTIEGDLFQAFVKAGAISKANADDPKKIAFQRCARTDKGVHAAGNVISLKLIIEDDQIVDKVNKALSPQIRVWGIERTSNGFSSYNFCDSRIYEYLIPTHCFLPPHPKSYLGQKLAEIAEEMGDVTPYEQRQADAASFWKETGKSYITPILKSFDSDVRDIAYRQVFEGSDNQTVKGAKKDASNVKLDVLSPIEQSMRDIRAGILEAKKNWRISPERISRIREALSQYVGVHNFHNYTIRKQFKDPSAKRVIKSFVVDETPILIDGSEWLSLKVHGQSFMMHQIRKMVGMVALVVRCGTSFEIMQKSMGPDRISIPRAPGLGLLLERPIFDSYNQKLKTQQGGPEKREIGFDRYAKEMDEFKQREIYARIYREEKQADMFHQLFWAVDNLRTPQYLYLSSKGLGAVTPTKQDGTGVQQMVDELDGSSDESGVDDG